MRTVLKRAVMTHFPWKTKSLGKISAETGIPYARVWWWARKLHGPNWMYRGKFARRKPCWVFRHADWRQPDKVIAEKGWHMKVSTVRLYRAVRKWAWKEKTDTQLAAQHGVSRQMIWRYKRMLGIKRRKPRKNPRKLNPSHRK